MMVILFWILKALGIVLLVLLALLLLLLFLPAGVTIQYTAEKTTMWITLLGCIRFPFPMKLLDKLRKSEGTEEKKTAEEEKPKGKKDAGKKTTPHKRKKLTMPLVIQLLEDAGAAMRKLLKALHVTVEDGYFPLTGKDKTGFPDAAATADLYGRTSASLSALLACLRNVLSLKIDHLRLEPDFTGERAGTQYCTCKIQAKLVIIVAVGISLLVRLWKSGVL